MAIADDHGVPVAVGLHRATPHEVTLAEEQAQKGTKLIAPQNERRINKPQDGRSLRRMKRRWHVEFFFAWLKRFRRVAIRYEVR
ncbi:MAG: transposase [Silvanigrellales bacterium]|nr:transposase [Silvanigrellales bacterium]